MAERAAYLVDEVLPRVPVRQWVLTLPYRLRYRVAWDHALWRAVLGVYARGLLAFDARTARSHSIPEGQTGTVTVIQRFGSGLQLNVHFHTLVLDGVFREARPGPLTFHPAPPPGDEDVAQVLATVRARVGRLLTRRQLEPEDDNAPPDPLRETSPVLAGLVSASVQACTTPGAIGALLRRERLYSSHLVEWRRARGPGELAALTPKKRRRKPTPVDPRDRKITALERQLAQMTGRAERAEGLVKAPKNLAALLGRPGATRAARLRRHRSRRECGPYRG